jgi:Zn-dependent protease with chaperone function
MNMIAAHYFDGRSARLHPVQLGVDDHSLLVSAAAFQRSYPLGTVALSEPFGAAPAVLRFADGASCEVDGDGRQQVLDALGYRKSRVVRWQERWQAALVALVLLIALLALMYFRGIPALAERLAGYLPASVDVSLGKAALSTLESRGMLAPSRLSDERLANVEALLPQVRPARPRMPIRLLVRHSPSLGANALALPDGTIIVTDKLVRLTLDRNNELSEAGKAQLIAVLGHEVGHIEHRHATRVMAGSSLTAALSAALFGDFSAVAAGLPAVLSQMQYSRTMELDADAHAVTVLHRNHLSAQALGVILSKLESQRPDAASTPRWMKDAADYVSTHPTTGERNQRITTAMAGEDPHTMARPQDEQEDEEEED